MCGYVIQRIWFDVIVLLPIWRYRVATELVRVVRVARFQAVRSLSDLSHIPSHLQVARYTVL